MVARGLRVPVLGSLISPDGIRLTAAGHPARRFALPRCTFAQVKAFLATGTGAKIFSVVVAKGRDYAWQGAVDGLRINSTIYDFEPLGVKIVPAP